MRDAWYELVDVDDTIICLAACGKSRRFWLDQIDRVSYT